MRGAEFIDAGMVPENFRFDDPSHMVRKDITAVLRHWRAAQEANNGRCAFRFKACLKTRGDEESELMPAMYETEKAGKGKAVAKKKKTKAAKKGKRKSAIQVSADETSAADDDSESEIFDLNVGETTSDEDDYSEQAKGAAPMWAERSRTRRQQWLEAASPSAEFRVIVDALPRLMVLPSCFILNHC